MANSFLKSASKQVVDVRGFLREAAGGSSIKYSAEKGAKHLVYIPYKMKNIIDEDTGATVQTKALVAISGDVHEWKTSDGKFHSTICLDGLVRKAEDGSDTLLNDGRCPFCERISDGWDIAKYRLNLEEENCKLSGEERKKHLETAYGNFRDERKSKETRAIMYMLVVKFRLNNDGSAIMGSDGLPEYDLKVMKLSASKIDKIQQQVQNAGSELPGSELIFEYPSTDDIRLLYSQSTTALVFPNNKQTTKFPELENKINEDVAKFDWDGIEKSFPEWKGMTSIEATAICTELFEEWDKYKEDLKVNPAAKYLEYVTVVPTTNPSLDGVTPVIPQLGNAEIPNIPVMPTVPNMVQPTATAPVQPTATAEDVNSVFAAGATQPITL